MTSFAVFSVFAIPDWPDTKTAGLDFVVGSAYWKLPAVSEGMYSQPTWSWPPSRS